MRQRKAKAIFSILAIAMMLLAASPVPAQGGTTKRVRFARGPTSTVIKNSVVRSTRDNYILGAREGQTLIVHISSVEDNASFAIHGSGSSHMLAEDVADWEGVLPHSGDWIIEVGPTRGNATYTLEVTIR
jgi:hypothetical protein